VDLQPNRHIVVIGAGLAGLAAGYALARRGHRITLLEAAPDLGGLASSVTIQGIPVERFYHFICRSDQVLVDLAHDLGLSDKLHWQPTRTAFFYHGRHYKFGRPLDLLRFAPVPFLQRIRFGLHILRSYYRSNWKWLDEIPAKAWLIENIGEEAYNVIWHPLLRVKFGDYDKQISAAWMWHRIWRVAQSRKSLFSREMFGYFEQGSATVIEALVNRLRAQANVTIQTGARVQPLEVREGRVTSVRVGDQGLPCDAVVSTVALPTLERLLPGQTHPYFTNARHIQYIGVVCLLLSLRASFSPNFWLNINDPQIAFNGVIEQTNLNHHWQKAGLNVLYVPFYLPTTAPRYAAADEALLAEYVPMLQRANPRFDKTWIKEWHVFRAPYAQAVCVTHFRDLVPAHRSPLGGLYVTDSTQFYPEDRTLSAAIQQGQRAAQAVLEDFAR
jgi:protoporphyrinogen oxidase